MTARKPNFFIVGAPKCGTTSLAAWLDGHPEACMSNPKEPHFFSPMRAPLIKTLHEYENCFAHARAQHIAIGEASTHTIYSERAITEILKYAPDARFIVCFRNPAEMAVSLHNYMVFHGDQCIEDFLTAWDSDIEVLPLYHDRAFGSGEFYRHVCALGTHLECLQQLVPAGRLLTVLLDDLVSDETRTLRGITDFLEIAPLPHAFPRENPAKQVRSKQVRRVAEGLVRAKERLGFRRSLKVGGWLMRANAAAGRGAAALPPEIRARLGAHFTPEVAKLEILLERDLSHWREPAADRGGD